MIKRMSDPRLGELQDSLETYFAAISSQKSDQPEPLPPVFERLAQAEVQAMPVAPPRLRHFLESKSYRKAHDFLLQHT